MKLSPAICRAIRKYERVETEGLCLYPITVAEYDEFMTARPAIEFMAQSLPVRYLSMPLLQAYWAMDVDAFTEGKQPVGLFYRCLLFLALSLRLGRGRDMQDRVQMVKPSLDAKDPRKLLGLTVPGKNGDTLITPIMFYRLRYILAAQNGIELVSDDANPDLIQAERDIAEAQSVPMDYRIESLLNTIAALEGADEAEMESWPILKLTNRQNAWHRILHFMVCGIGQASGMATYKGGNPYPSPFYDRIRDDSGGLISMNEFAGGQGLAAMKNPSATAPTIMPEQTN